MLAPGEGHVGSSDRISDYEFLAPLSLGRGAGVFYRDLYWDRGDLIASVKLSTPELCDAKQVLTSSEK
jgi:hypothetical protein